MVDLWEVIFEKFHHGSTGTLATTISRNISKMCCIVLSYSRFVRKVTFEKFHQRSTGTLATATMAILLHWVRWCRRGAREFVFLTALGFLWISIGSVLCCVCVCVCVCFAVWQCVAVCCIVVQCGAGCCSVLQCVVVCCSVLQCLRIRVPDRIGILVDLDWYCDVLYVLCVCVCCKVAVCCSVLQCVAVLANSSSQPHWESRGSR